MTGYTVTTDSVRRSAIALNNVKSNVDVAADAGHTTSLNSESFGMICSFLYPPAQSVQNSCVSQIKALADMLAETVSAVHAIADSYDSIDDELGASMRSLQSNLPMGG